MFISWLKNPLQRVFKCINPADHFEQGITAGGLLHQQGEKMGEHKIHRASRVKASLKTASPTPGSCRVLAAARCASGRSNLPSPAGPCFFRTGKTDRMRGKKAGVLLRAKQRFAVKPGHQFCKRSSRGGGTKMKNVLPNVLYRRGDEVRWSS